MAEGIPYDTEYLSVITLDANTFGMPIQATPGPSFFVNFYRCPDDFVRQFVNPKTHNLDSTSTLLCATSMLSVSLW